MKIKMLVPLAGTGKSLGKGEVHDCDEAEAARHIEAGHAVPLDDRSRERAIRQGPVETR